MRYVDKLNEIRKQLDTRWKQIDKFESSVKSYGDTKSQWRRKFAAKEGELEALKVLFFVSVVEVSDFFMFIEKSEHESGSSISVNVSQAIYEFFGYVDV